MIEKSKEMFMHFSLIFVIGLSIVSAGCWKNELTVSVIGGGTSSETSEAVTVNAPSGMTMITASPGNDTTPEIQVSGIETGYTVKIYSDSDCSTSVVGSATSSGTNVNVTLSTSLTPDGSYTFYSTATDTDSNISVCSAASAGYTLDTTSPATPSLTLSDPASTPGNDDTPTFEVTGIEIDDTIRIYTDAGCTVLKGSKVATATTENVVSSALADASYTFYANSTDSAGNVSGCSLVGAIYEVDTAAPATPTTLSLINPASSPNTDKTPEIQVNGVVDGNTVFLHSNATCTATLKSGLSTGTTISITTDELGDADYTIYANTTDPAGNVSACSATGIDYTVDTAAPAAPTSLSLIDPASSPSNDKTPEIQVNGVVDGNTVFLHSNATCTATLKSGLSTGTTISITTDELGDA
ncbi:MAG: hypothetical protein KAQ98_01235, partial [Bacteriovoracaceae bacterium]|nr:hypothetical protein [Bacteriovoracaceae bacterium]